MEWRKKYPTREACEAAVDCMGRFAGVTKHDSDCRICSYAYAITHEDQTMGATVAGDSTAWFHFGATGKQDAQTSNAVKSGHITNGPLEVPVITPSGKKALWTHALQRLVHVGE